MKNLFKALFSFLFAATMVFPVEAMATPAQNFEEAAEGQEAKSFESDDYSLTFLTGDFGLSLSRTAVADQAGTLIVFITNPDGRIVKNAQVVTTIIGQNGGQLMRRARPFKGAYLIDTAQLAPGQYRLEAEIITDGQLLTDEFHFQHT